MAISNHTKQPDTDREQVEANIALTRRFYDEIFVRGHIDVAGEIVAANFIDHIPNPMPGQPSAGPKAVHWLAETFRTAFPDLTVSIDDIIAIGEKVVTRVTWRGTQRGPLLGADPTGKRVRFTGIDITRVVSGRIVEHWGQVDVLGVMEQLGFLPL